MSNIMKKMYANKPDVVSATLYTVPPNTTGAVKNVLFCNTTGTQATITLTVAGQTIFNALPVAANDTFSMDTTLVMNAGDIITGIQTTSGAIVAYISGIERV